MSELFNKISSKILPVSSMNRSLVFLFSLIFVSCFATYYFFGKQNQSVDIAAPEAELSRNYSYSPFNMSDAYQYCVVEAKKQMGPAFQRYAMDNVSTQYRKEEDIFFIVLKVDVGSVRNFREAIVYCNVDPNKYLVSYYKEIYPGENRSILSRTIEFFSEL